MGTKAAASTRNWLDFPGELAALALEAGAGLEGGTAWLQSPGAPAAAVRGGVEGLGAQLRRTTWNLNKRWLPHSRNMACGSSPISFTRVILSPVTSIRSAAPLHPHWRFHASAAPPGKIVSMRRNFSRSHCDVVMPSSKPSATRRVRAKTKQSTSSSVVVGNNTGEIGAATAGTGAGSSVFCSTIPSASAKDNESVAAPLAGTGAGGACHCCCAGKGKAGTSANRGVTSPSQGVVRTPSAKLDMEKVGDGDPCACGVIVGNVVLDSETARWSTVSCSDNGVGAQVSVPTAPIWTPPQLAPHISPAPPILPKAASWAPKLAMTCLSFSFSASILIWASAKSLTCLVSSSIRWSLSCWTCCIETTPFFHTACNRAPTLLSMSFMIVVRRDSARADSHVARLVSPT
mmetsp:Transcript_87391/g.187425  ORF Transcript_87391/g.187425 Transcript_87391/m.187425 type:complete len:403 (+) Transcript_87391:176-1384(+)